MNHSNAVFLFIFAFCTFVVPHQTAAQGSKGNDLINQVCETSKAKNLCLRVLQSDPTSPKADLKGLAMISLKVSKQYASTITGVLKKLATDDDLEPTVQQGLADCRENYVDAEAQVEDAVAALLVGNMSDAQKWLQTALAATDTCDEAIKGNDPALFGRNEGFRHLLDIASTICNNLAAAAQ